MLRSYFRSLDDGNVQKQRKILVGRVRKEGDALSVLVELVLHDVGEAAFIIVTFPGGIVGGDHIRRGDPGAVRKPGIFV